jgi:hypothetical protein
MARGDRVRSVATRTVENSLQALLAARFRTQAQMVAALTDHPVLVGTGRENAVGALLQELLPRRFEVLSGIIAQLDDDGRPRRAGDQDDILVADTLDFPVLLRMGSTAVVVPDSVRAIIEVKSTLARPPSVGTSDAASAPEEGEAPVTTGTTETFLDALVQIGKLRLAVRDGGPSVHTMLLSHGAPVYPRRLREWLELCLAARKAMPEGVDRTALGRFALPDLIVSVSGTMAVKNSSRTSYEFFRCPADGSKDGSAVVAAIGQVLAAVAPAIPGDRARVDEAFAFVLRYLSTDTAPAEGCPELPL